MGGRRQDRVGEAGAVFTYPREVNIEGFVCLVSDDLLLVDERGTDSWEQFRGAVVFGEKVGGCGEGHEAGVAGMNEGVAEGAGEGCYEDFGAGLGDLLDWWATEKVRDGGFARLRRGFERFFPGKWSCLFGSRLGHRWRSLLDNVGARR